MSSAFRASNESQSSTHRGSPNRGSPNRVPLPQAIAACIAFAAFTVSVLVGIVSGNPIEAILTRALVSMVVAFAGGFAVGLVCDWMVGQETRRIEQSMRAELAESQRAEVDLDGLTGVDVIEDDEKSLAA